MSLLPLLLSLDDSDRGLYNRYVVPSFDHHFGLGIHPEQLAEILVAPSRLRQSLAEIERHAGAAKGAVTTVGKDGFQVSLDVQQFKPNEVTVKLQDNTVVIEGKHEEREDQHGYISRHFTRKYVLPKEVDIEQLASSLSSDGILTIKAPKKQAAIEGERVIQIQQTGPARNSIKENPKDPKDEEKK